ncbi:unnamed protein product [Fraxinus pennsylvanica]|uniref:Ribosomal protein L33 n=1 Tax=Fraxinus pennsylvanica TaxID=56036 RepID=A0AAD2A1Y4_9LAMI|nr:unnamed protein product [Fraxinus pennsylvanica]
MGEKKKAGAMLVRLVSAAGTGFFYVVKKTKRLQSSQIKLEFRKYDPRVNRHVLFTEAKMKSAAKEEAEMAISFGGRERGGGGGDGNGLKGEEGKRGGEGSRLRNCHSTTESVGDGPQTKETRGE